MKISIKIIIFIFLIVCTFCTIVKAGYFPVYSDKLYIQVSNIDNDIKKVELLVAKNYVPSNLFQFKMAKQYGYYNENEEQIPIWNKEEIVKEKDRGKYYKGKKAFGLEEEVRLYQITEYDKSKYIVLNPAKSSYNMTNVGIVYDVYYDSNKNPFSLFKIENSKEINNFKLDNGKFELLIKEFKKYGEKPKSLIDDDLSNIFLRFYKSDNEFKDIAIGRNCFWTAGTMNTSTAIVSKEVDYQNGDFIKIKDSSKFDYLQVVNKIVWIGIAILLIITIFLIVKKNKKLKNSKK